MSDQPTSPVSESTSRDAPLYEVQWRGSDDYIPDLGLERIGALIEKLPTDGYDMTMGQASQRSVTATFKFDAADPFGQANALEACCNALTVVRTLHANLVAARARLAELEARDV